MVPSALITIPGVAITQMVSVPVIMVGQYTGREKFSYTTDGSTPTPTVGRVIPGPVINVTISASTILKVIVFHETTLESSPVSSEQYTVQPSGPVPVPILAPLYPTTQPDKRVGFYTSLHHPLLDIPGIGTNADNALWEIVDGSIPDGMQLDPLTGTISGTPTDEDTYVYTIRVTTDYGSAEDEFTASASLSSFTFPLPSPYSSLDSAMLESKIRLGYHIIKRDTLTKATVRISWNKLGLADLENTVIHEISVREGVHLMPAFPKVFEYAEAYNDSYSLVVRNWDLQMPHTVTLTINDIYTKTLEIPRPPMAGSEKPSLTSGVDINKNKVTVENKESGIEIKLNSCQDDVHRLYKNVRVYRETGCVAKGVAMPLKFVRSAELPLSIGNTYIDYSQLVLNGKPTESFTQSDFERIYNDRQYLLVQIRYDDTEGNFIEETDQKVIANTPEHEVSIVLNEVYLDLEKHNDPSLLYHTQNSDKYWRYRDNPSAIPFQSNMHKPDATTEWLPYSLLDADYDDTISVPVPGYLIMPDTAVTLTAAIRSSEGDYTLLGTVIYTEPNLTLELENQHPGVKFLSRPCCHTDTDVTDGAWYTYQVDIETWTGQIVTLFHGYIKREVITVAELSETMALESLRVPARAPLDSLTEYDFQSGPSRGVKVFLSDDPDDIVVFEATRGLDTNGSCGCDCVDC